MSESTGPVAVVMLNLGGPDSLDAVEPFLYNIFSDPDVIQLPLGALIQKPLARFVSRRRAEESRRMYERLGGRSPIAELTAQQARALESRLGSRFRTYVGMRAWKPTIEAAVDQLVADGASSVVALPLYPQRSRTTTGSSMRELRRVLSLRAPTLPLHEVCCYATEPRFLDAWAERVKAKLDALPDERRESAHVLFSAHGLPQKLIDRGDPYLAHTQATVAGVMERIGASRPHSLAFQSRATPVRWLEPTTPDALERLAREGTRDVLVVPISFLTDHVETLYELDILIAEHARRVGLEGYHRVDALNLSALLIEALAGLAQRAVGQSERVCATPALC